MTGYGRVFRFARRPESCNDMQSNTRDNRVRRPLAEWRPQVPAKRLVHESGKEQRRRRGDKCGADPASGSLRSGTATVHGGRKHQVNERGQENEDVARAIKQARTVSHVPEMSEEDIHVLPGSKEDREREQADDEVVAAHGRRQA